MKIFLDMTTTKVSEAYNILSRLEVFLQNMYVYIHVHFVCGTFHMNASRHSRRKGILGL